MNLHDLGVKIRGIVESENAQGVILLINKDYVEVVLCAETYKIGVLLGMAAAAAKKDCKAMGDESYTVLKRGIDLGFKKFMETFNERN